MQVNLHKEFVDAHKAFFEAPPYEFDLDRHRYWDGQPVNLRKLTMAQVKELLAKAEAKKLKGTTTLARDLKVWIRANETVDGAAKTRARTMLQACELLIEYIRRLPHKHVYSREEEGVEGVVLPYYVEGIKYHPPVKYEYSWSEPYITMDLFYRKYGVTKSIQWTFRPRDCLGLTPYEMLVKADVWPETPELRADQEYWMEVWQDARDHVGRQYLATGVADDSGVDGNPNSDSGWWSYTRASKFNMDHGGTPTRVLVDVFRETDEERRGDENEKPNIYFWRQKDNLTYKQTGEVEWNGDHDEEGLPELEKEDVDAIEIPIHPYLRVFDLKRHLRLNIHVGNLERYVYNTELRKSLVLPDTHAKLLDVLLVEQDKVPFMDVIKNKSGGTIVLLEGPPGTGKTLTAEILSEAMQRPLFIVQCSQLGITADDLEENLMIALARAKRWNAIMLLDEADVYVHKRGDDLVQNAIVGVFLRVLEYHSSVLFMTTNRGDLVDDAILSRCTARIPYGPPAKEDQVRIWAILTEVNGLDVDWGVLANIVDAHPRLSGRDIKNLLKLAMMVAHSRGVDLSPALITEVKSFKPTFDAGDMAHAASVE